MADSPTSEVWLRTNEIEEFLDALEHSARLAEQVRKDVRVWKWLIIALHSALQGACVCALRGHDTAGVTMLTETSGKKVWYWLDVESRQNPRAKMPKERLASLLSLLSRVRDPRLLPSPHTLSVSDEAVADIKRLNSLRNDFIHFVPRGWSVELSGMPRIVSQATDAIEHLAIDQPTLWHHLGCVERDRIASALEALREQILIHK